MDFLRLIPFLILWFIFSVIFYYVFTGGKDKGDDIGGYAFAFIVGALLTWVIGPHILGLFF